MLDLCCEFLPMCRDLEILYDDVYWSYGMYILEMYDLYPLWLLRNFIYACYLYFVEDVASISWIYASFVCFIDLIEIGRYTPTHGKTTMRHIRFKRPRPATFSSPRSTMQLISPIYSFVGKNMQNSFISNKAVFS